MEEAKEQVLVACGDKDDFFISTLCYCLEAQGYAVKSVTTFNEARKLFTQRSFSLAIVDAPFPEGGNLVEHLKCRKSTSQVPVIQLMESGAKENWFTTFRFLGNHQVYQPYEIHDIIEISKNELERFHQEQGSFEQEVYFKFPTEDQWVDRANDVAAKLFADAGLGATVQVQMCTAFREAISNAAQHGNRYRRDRLIDVQYYVDPQQISINVTDMGKGFSWGEYLEPERDPLEIRRKRAATGKLGGLGILLMCKCCDKVEYNDKGNVITLTKFRDRAET